LNGRTNVAATLTNTFGYNTDDINWTGSGMLSGNSGTLIGSGATAGSATTFSSTYTGLAYGPVTLSGSATATNVNLGGSAGSSSMSVTINVGNATADASGVGKGTYGTALTALVDAKGGSYASYDGLASKVTTTVNGSLASLGTQATILYGSNTSASAQTVSMQWRTRTAAEAAATNATPLVSDVVSVSGMTTSGSQSNPFLLEMTFNPSNLKYGANSLSTCIANDNIYIVSNGSGVWENTVLENSGGTAHYMGLSDPNALSINDTNLSNYLGDYGVWTSASGSDYAWAVVNHNSEFAVIPEPSTLGLLIAGFLSLIAYAWRKRK
jgi:hypothetical protein